MPLGTLLGGAAGWRATFLFVALLGALAAGRIARFLPASPRAPRTSLGAMLGVLRRPRVAALATVTTLTMTGTFVVFAYVAPLVGLIAGGGTATVAAALLVFGVFAVPGNALGGAATDRVGSRRTLVAGLGVLGLSLAALRVFANLGFSSVAVWGAAVASAAWSACNWGFHPPQQERLLEAAPDAGGGPVLERLGALPGAGAGQRHRGLRAGGGAAGQPPALRRPLRGRRPGLHAPRRRPDGEGGTGQHGARSGFGQSARTSPPGPRGDCDARYQAQTAYRLD